MIGRRIMWICVLVFSLPAHRASGDGRDSVGQKRHFELSFGQSLLFISQSKSVSLRNSDAVVIPTSAVLFLGELRPDKLLRVPVFLNVATESKQFIVNGQVISERAAPTFGLGLQFRLLKLKIDSESKFDAELGPLASLLFNKNKDIKFAPVIAGRLRLQRGKNFTMYAGGSYSLGINAFGLIFGTGTIF